VGDSGPIVSARLPPLPDLFTPTVTGLHRVAEQLVAPARKPENEIALEASSGGFGTPEFEFAGARQRIRIDADELVREVDGEERRAPLCSLAEAGAVVADLLAPGVELSEEPLGIDRDSALALAAIYEFGGGVLGELATGAEPAAPATEPILWPEHFDLAIEHGDEAAGERGTYGLSPGDENHPEPYLYVGPWRQGVMGELFQARGFRGAEFGYADLLAATDQRAAALDFFETRQAALKTTGT
jgi:hypothetical protein